MGSILVTGAAGFIGSHVAEQLLARGETVVGVDELNSYYPVAYKERNLAALSSYRNFTFHKLDITSREAVDRLFDSVAIDRVGHLAARAGVRPSIQDPFIYEHANVLGTMALLDAAARHKVRSFVLCSSSSVYGNSTQIPFREDDSATDRPISPYAATKKACEVLGYTYHHLYGLPVNVIRPFTVYGPRGRPDMAPWLFLQAAMNGTVIRKFGDGSTRRDYTFIGDFAQGFIAAIDRPDGYEIFNLGNSATVSLSEVLEIIARVSGRTLNIVEEPLQPGDVLLTNADISKAREKLGYDPKVSFEEGMRIFHRWFVEHQTRAE